MLTIGVNLYIMVASFITNTGPLIPGDYFGAHYFAPRYLGNRYFS